MRFLPLSSRYDCVQCLLGNQAGFVEKLIAFQHSLLVPGSSLQSKSDLDPFLPAAAKTRIGSRLSPPGQSWGDLLIDHGWAPPQPILPGKVLVPVSPVCFSSNGKLFLPHQGQIGYGNDPRSPLTNPRFSIAVPETVELFDIPQLDPGLFSHPAIQAQLKRAVSSRVKRTKRECVRGCPLLKVGLLGHSKRIVRVLYGEDSWPVIRDRHDHSV